MDLIIAAAQSVSFAGDVSKNVAHHLEIASIAAGHGVKLLVFPELSLIGYELAIARQHVVRPESPELEPLSCFARDARMTIVAGAPSANGNGDLHIAAFAFRPDGSMAIYTKEHVHSSEQHVFACGSGGAALELDDAVVSLAICADATYPDHAAKAAAAGADIYAVGVMIDGAGYGRKTKLLEGYASEHKMVVAMANYSGVTGGETSAGRSTIWRETGQIVAASPDADEALVIGRRRDKQWTGHVIPLSL